jgi:AraC family transcriptional regulator, transcriptional activator of pobA
LLTDLAGMARVNNVGIMSRVQAAQLALVLVLAEELIMSSDDQAVRDPHEALVRRFREAVDRHYREGWSIARYAVELGTSPPTLTRSCRAVLLQSPGEVVLNRLLLEAMRALTFTTTSIGRIAEDLGFSDPAYFSKFFRARTGLNARAFRRNRTWFSRGGIAAQCNPDLEPSVD